MSLDCIHGGVLLTSILLTKVLQALEVQNSSREVTFPCSIFLMYLPFYWNLQFWFADIIITTIQQNMCLCKNQMHTVVIIPASVLSHISNNTVSSPNKNFLNSSLWGIFISLVSEENKWIFIYGGHCAHPPTLQF